MGPTLRSPAKNRPMAPTVETTARPPSQAKPAALTPARPAAVRVAVAPVHTSVSGATRPAIPSEPSTYPR